MKNTPVFFVLLAVICFSCTPSTEDLQWNQENSYQWAELSTGYFWKTGFSELKAGRTNIEFENSISGENIKNNRNFLNGSGVAAADVDGDGFVDLYFAALEASNKLYKNLGDFEFEDITKKAGLAHKEYHSTGAVFADVNGDSHPDLLITSLKKQNELYINDGNGNFILKEDSGLEASNGSTTMALADIDQDGDLDLYITNYKLKSARDIFTANELAVKNTVKKQGDSLIVVPPFDKFYGIIETEGQSYRNEYGAKDDLYLNNGDGTFQKVKNDKKTFRDQDGNPLGLSRDWGLTAKFQDINADGYPDLYVTNDFWTPDRIWINQGDGTFRCIRRNAIRSMSFSSMGVDFTDVNRDGNIDIFVTEMLSDNHQRRLRQFSDYLDPIDGRPQYNRNSLYLNRGDSTFAEVSNFSDLSATEWSWATNFIDVNLDGYEDVIINTGNAYDYLDIDMQLEINRRATNDINFAGNILEYPTLELTNKIYRNNGDLTFTDKSSEWGFTEEDISHGMAIADLDNDGDADFVINRLNNNAAIFKNETNASRIVVQLAGEKQNTEAIGANIRLEGASVPQQKQVSAGGSYLSGSQNIVFFAADENNQNHKIEVEWPDGRVTVIDSVQANRIYNIDQSSAVTKKVEGEKLKKKLFMDISDRISHTHHEDPYADFNMQPLLPAYLSQQGPGVSWIDYNRDGHDDLLIGTGEGGKMGIFKNRGDGKFEKVTTGKLSSDALGDQTAIIGWQEVESTEIIVGSANLEQEGARVPSAFHYSLGKNQINSQQIPGILSITGPVAAADYDNDGDIDVFIGGEFKPGEYPRNASSRFFNNNNGTFVLDHSNSNSLKEAGLISAAVFTDYDRDGDQDLILSRVWDSILLFENRDGVFYEIGASRELDKYTGWWKGIATGDFNNDGRPDIVATNIGNNSIYQPDPNHPLKLFYSDFDLDGTVDIIDSYYDSSLEDYVPRRRLYELKSMRSILGIVGSHQKYARSTVTDIFKHQTEDLPFKEINTVQHIVFINQKEGFEARPLPQFSQFSAAIHPSVADFNNDGNEDIFLTQNFFAFANYIPRSDAGRGLLLLGKGDGNFEIIKGQQSGIKVYGEQRGATVSDFNKDGRADLAISQNQDTTKLYLNQSDKRGIRIQLEGPFWNKNGIGSAFRLIYEDGTKGPLREVQAGSGYRSQQSSVMVLGYFNKAVKGIEVQWFDGKTAMTRTSLESMLNKKEYVITYK